MSATQEGLTAIDEIGPEIAASIVEFFHEQKNIHVINKFSRAGVVPRSREKQDQAPLKGQSFVFTGTLQTLARNEAKTIVENLGGAVLAGVTRKTSYVVAGSDPGSKLDKARSSGIKIISENEFLKLIGR